MKVRHIKRTRDRALTSQAKAWHAQRNLMRRPDMMAKLARQIDRDAGMRGLNRMHWMLDEHGAPRLATLGQWSVWMETANRKLKDDYVDGWHISTVFLGLDHNHFANFPGAEEAGYDIAPILWETMVFAPAGETGHDWLDQYMDRYRTKEEAQAGHARAVRFVEHRHAVSQELAEALIARAGKDTP